MTFGSEVRTAQHPGHGPVGSGAEDAPRLAAPLRRPGTITGRQPGGRDPTRGRPIIAADGAPVDSRYIVVRLEEAGQTLLALPPSGWSTRLRTTPIDIVRTAAEAYGWDGGRLRPAMPDSARIDRMEQALAWIPLIPLDRYVLRRIVGARALVSPVNDRHLFTWRRLGSLLGADHKAIQRWHGQGIDIIVAAVNRIAA